MKKSILVLSLIAMSSVLVSCSKSPESQAEACMKALLSNDVAEIKKSFMPDIAEALTTMGLSNLEAISKQNREIVSVKPVELSGENGVKHVFAIEHKAAGQTKTKTDKVYLIEEAGTLYCAIKK